MDVPVGAVSARHGGGLVVAAGTGFATLDEQTGELDWLWEGGLGDRMNDGKSATNERKNTSIGIG